MGTSYNPPIVKNGLVLNVDPANIKSYPAASDSNRANVSLLLDFDGANGSTTFVDKSLNNLTVTANGNAQISTAQSKFGGSSVYFDGNGDYITATSGSLFQFSGDFTIEFWAYSTETSGSSLRGMFDTRSSQPSANGIMLRENGTGYLVYGNASTLITTGAVRTANTWTHLALVRSGSTITLYVNGTSAGTATNSTNYSDGQCLISGFIDTKATPYGFLGYIDDLRVTKAARYTSSFTPPGRLIEVPGRIYDLTTNKGTGSFVGSGVSYSSTNAGIVTLDGSNGYGVLPNTLTVGPTSTFTLCAWVNYISRPTAGVARRSVLDQSVNTNDFEPILGFPYTYSASKMGLEVGKAGVGSQIAYSSYTNNLNEWYYLTGLFKNGSADFYINGVYQSTVTYDGTVNSATANTKNWGIGGVFFNGSITSPYANCRVGPIQIYNRNLIASEILQNYIATKGRFGL